MCDDDNSLFLNLNVNLNIRLRVCTPSACTKNKKKISLNKIKYNTKNL